MPPTFWVDKTAEVYLETTINWQWATATSVKSAENSAKPEDKQRECGSTSKLWTSTISTEGTAQSLPYCIETICLLS